MLGTATCDQKELAVALKSLAKATEVKWGSAFSEGVRISFTEPDTSNDYGGVQTHPVMDMVTTGGLLTVGRCVVLKDLNLSENTPNLHVIVSAAIFGDVAKSFPKGDIQLEWDDSTLYVNSGDISYELTRFYDEPALVNAPEPPDDSANAIGMSGDEFDNLMTTEALQTVVAKAARCASTDKGKVSLRTVQIKAEGHDIYAWGTDGFRVTCAIAEGCVASMTGVDDVYLPIEVATIATGVFEDDDEVFIEDIGRHTVIRAITNLGWAMVLKLQVKPPDLAKMLNRFALPNELTFDIEHFTAMMKRLRSMARDKSASMKLEIDPLANRMNAGVVAKQKGAKASEWVKVDMAPNSEDGELSVKTNYWYLFELVDQFPKKCKVTMNYGQGMPLVKFTNDQNASVYTAMLIQ